MEIKKEIAEKVGMRLTKTGIIGDLYQLREAIKLQREFDNMIENEVEQIQLNENNEDIDEGAIRL
jgi:hypothetical protein